MYISRVQRHNRIHRVTNRGTNVTLDVTLYPELTNEEKTIMIAIKNNNKITREELARLIKKYKNSSKNIQWFS